ncbi:MAG TPA: hypothetical protein VIK78_12825 [Ruminiclostridium sp.]
MFRTHNTAVIKDREVLENIKREIEIQLGKRGVILSGINMEINPENISLSIFISAVLRTSR